MTDLSQGCVDPTSPNLARIRIYHRAIIAALHFCFSVRISCCIFKRGQLKLSDVQNDAKFRTFDTPVNVMWEG